MHLSYHPGNDGTNNADFSLRQGAQMAKIDIKCAFRLYPVLPTDHHLLGMKWKGQFYFDHVLPFGLRSTPFIFNCLADALEWIAIQQGVSPVHHYIPR